jgi:RimK family alpha-L-glutamate ligase
MHLGIVAGNRGWHVRDLERAAGTSSRVTFVDITQLSSANDLLHFDSLVLRTIPAGSLEQTIFRLALLYRAERAGLRIINTPACFEACVDKFTTTARLQAANLPTPKTICCQTIDAAMAAFEELGRDVVIKPLFGSEGKGLIRVTEADAAWRAISMLVQLGAVVYLQEFIPHPGFDLRAFVLGGRVLCAMKRSHPIDWRTNLARGATAEAITLSKEEEALALAAAKAAHADIAGVDLLPTKDGRWQVLEVNGVPGWQGLGKATGVDVAQKVLEFCSQCH